MRGTIVRAVAAESANDETLRRVQPASGMMPTPQESVTQQATAPSLAERQRPDLVRCMDAAAYHRQQNQTWAEDFRQRMECIGAEGSRTDNAGAGGLEWWHGGSAANPAGSHRDRLQQFVADHTLPEYDSAEVDVYDSKPRVVAYGPVRTASARQETQPGNGTFESASSRLKRSRNGRTT